MPIETLTYADLADRLKISPEAARSLTKRLRLQRSRANDGKTLVTVDLAEIRHTAMPARSSGGNHAVAAKLKAQIADLDRQLEELKAALADMRGDRDAWRSLAETTLAARELAARELTAREDELAALRSRPWWRRLAG